MDQRVRSSLREISLDEVSDILAVSKINQTLDLGACVVHDLTHPFIGDITIVNTAGGRSALFRPQS